jgi:hypothetical protein
MLTGALAGALKVSAVALTAGGLATGVYFAVQAGQDSGNEPVRKPVAAPTPGA